MVENSNKNHCGVQKKISQPEFYDVLQRSGGGAVSLQMIYCSWNQSSPMSHISAECWTPSVSRSILVTGATKHRVIRSRLAISKLRGAYHGQLPILLAISKYYWDICLAMFLVMPKICHQTCKTFDDTSECSTEAHFCFILDASFPYFLLKRTTLLVLRTAIFVASIVL